jgi:hypothetical protein
VLGEVSWPYGPQDGMRVRKNPVRLLTFQKEIWRKGGNVIKYIKYVYFGHLKNQERSLHN